MFLEMLNTNFDKSVPIFSDEILSMFKNYSKQYVFRLLKKAIKEGDIMYYDRGVYYIPEKTFFGYSSINPDQIVKKKYIKNQNEIFGVYSGLSLLNFFGITTQMPNHIEIVTNNEATRKRIIKIANRTYIIRKSRITITNENMAAYTIMQLFNDIEDIDVINKSSLQKITYFINKNNITFKQLAPLVEYFPSKTLKRIMRSEMLYGALQG